MDATAGIIIVTALLVGLVVGWLLSSRAAAPLKSECDELRRRCGSAESGSAAAEERAKATDQLRPLLTSVTGERDEALREVERLRTGAAEREKAFEARIAELGAMRDTLVAQFKEVSTQALGDAQKHFLERADARFNQAGEKHEEKLKSLLAPVETTLKRYEEGLTRVEKEREGSYGELKQAVAQLTLGNDVVRRETSRLANVMRSSPKARGRWGEEQLRTILESAGLAENVDFTLQASVNDGERQLRPDCVIHLPGGRCIVIDVKCPLVHFESAFDEEDEEIRSALLRQHASAMGAYANDLGRKAYWRQFDLSPDFVIMFIPGEHFLSAAAERAPELIETAYRQGVIVASTINMLALAKVMAGMWRQQSLAAQAKEVADAGKEVYAALRVLGGHVRLVGENLERASANYNKLVGTLEGGLWRGAKRLEELKVDTGGQIVGEPKLADVAIRPLAKLAAGEAPEPAE